MKKERILELRVRLPLDQGQLQQHVGEPDSEFYDRLMKETTVTGLLNGCYGKFSSSVAVFGKDGLAAAWTFRAKRKTSDEAVGD